MTNQSGGVRWGRVGAGVALAAAASIWVSAAAASGQRWAWGAAGLAFVLGTVLLVSGFQRAPATRTAQSMWGAEPRKLPSGDRHPLIGELLVYKYNLITEAQLTQALVKQRETHQKLGEVLVDMGLVTTSQVAIALADQQSHGDPFGTASEQPGDGS